MSTALARQDRTAEAADLDRFRRHLRQRSIGPHAYAVLLGLDTVEAAALLRAVDTGLPYRAFDRFRRNTTLPIERLLALVGIPRRTLARRKADGRFLPDESDRLFRAARLFGRTLQLFEGDRDAAVEWLTTPQTALGDRVPLDLARTEIGAREVERLVGRLDHGVFS
jgi:putative toxin-antitoxin system antitoxin component (TIGR02293 family)